MTRSTKYILVIAALIPFFHAAAFSQTLFGTLKGRVIDAANKKPLGDVVVLIREHRTNMLTDREGRFLVGQVPAGSYTVDFVQPGYAGLTKTDVRIRAGESTVLAIELAALVPQLRVQVNVQGERLPAEERKASSVATLNFEETVRMPGTVMDVSRALNALPGTSHVSEISNDLIVRGGSPWENGFYIDNIEMPNVNHLQSQGSSGGMIGIINALFIEDVNFYTGGYAARFGNRMSSIIDIKFREGSRERTTYQLNLNLAGFGASAEGPFLGKKASWLFSFSRNYHDLIAKMIGYGVAPRFGDVHFKLTFDPTPRDKFTLLNVYGQSALSYGLDTAVGEGFMGALDYSSRQNTVGLNWLSEWAGGAGSSNTTLSYSFYRISYRLTDLVPSSAWMDYILNEEGTDSLVLRNINAVSLGRRNKAEFGADIRWETADFKNYFTEYINRWGMDIPAADEQSRTRTSMAGAFLTFILRPWEPLTLSVGVRADYFFYNRRAHLSPRFAASFGLSSNLTLNASFGIFRQVLPMFLLASNAANKLNRDPLAVHAILGLKFDPSESLRLSFELYDKEYRYFPLAPENPSLFVMDSGIDFEFFRTYAALVDTGTAHARGVEVFLQKRIIEKFYGIFSVSLFRSTFRDYFGIQRDRVNDNRYIMTVVGGYKPNDKWNVSVRWNLAGGVPYTPFDVEASRQANMGMIDKSQILARRYPDYMTFNFRLDRRWVFSRSSLNLFLSIVNAFNRKNMDRYYWNRIENKPDVVYQAPLIPVFGVEYRF
ncbi:MAG: TonB-dependent receptor [Candidatus Aminicenantes bacterium]|nr:TonB-dependent receptor [Candidatus Aminicenantes bacterium]